MKSPLLPVIRQLPALSNGRNWLERIGVPSSEPVVKRIGDNSLTVGFDQSWILRPELDQTLAQHTPILWRGTGWGRVVVTGCATRQHRSGHQQSKSCDQRLIQGR